MCTKNYDQMMHVPETWSTTDGWIDGPMDRWKK